jgi:hypothetical protein
VRNGHRQGSDGIDPFWRFIPSDGQEFAAFGRTGSAVPIVPETTFSAPQRRAENVTLSTASSAQFAVAAN